MFVGLVRDITKRKRAEDMSRRAKAAAEAANRTSRISWQHEPRDPNPAETLSWGWTYRRSAPILVAPQTYLTKIGIAGRSLRASVNTS